MCAIDFDIHREENNTLLLLREKILLTFYSEKKIKTKLLLVRLSHNHRNTIILVCDDAIDEIN